MLEVKMNKEVRDVKENVFFGFSLKPLIILGIGIVINTILYFTVGQMIEESFRVVIIIIGICPFIFLAFYQKDGLTGWQYIKSWLYYHSMPEYFFFVGHSLWRELEGQTRTKKGEKNEHKAGKGDNAETQPGCISD